MGYYKNQYILAMCYLRSGKFNYLDPKILTLDTVNERDKIRT